MIVELNVGQLVLSAAGRDRGRYFLVWKIDFPSVYLVDGKHRTIDKPKRKNLRHIRPTGRFAADLDLAGSRVSDQEIRAAIFNLR